mgnify:FL=1
MLIDIRNTYKIYNEGRENEIRAFQPKEYWSLDVKLNRIGKPGSFVAHYYGSPKKQELENEEQTQNVIHDITGKEFTVMKISADDSQVVLGVPAGKDATGAVNKYLCANLTIKPITSDNGPVEVKVDNSVINGYFETNANAFQYRIDIYNPWGGTPMVDITKMKLKKNQKLVIKYKIAGIQWKAGAEPIAAISDNAIVNKWGADVFADATAVKVAADDSEKTIELVNNTGATVNFEGTSCVSLCLFVGDMAEGPLGEDGSFDSSQVTAEITSITIHTIQ